MIASLTSWAARMARTRGGFRAALAITFVGNSQYSRAAITATEISGHSFAV